MKEDLEFTGWLVVFGVVILVIVFGALVFIS